MIDALLLWLQLLLMLLLGGVHESMLCILGTIGIAVGTVHELLELTFAQMALVGSAGMVNTGITVQLVALTQF